MYVHVCTLTGIRWNHRVYGMAIGLAEGSTFTSRGAHGYECLDLYLNKPSVLSAADKCYGVRRSPLRYNGRFLSSERWHCVTWVNRPRLEVDWSLRQRHSPEQRNSQALRHQCYMYIQRVPKKCIHILRDVIHVLYVYVFLAPFVYNSYICTDIQAGVRLISIDIFRQLFKISLSECSLAKC